jgi:UDP-N-acetyl-D-galactosamine dehydrogenase
VTSGSTPDAARWVDAFYGSIIAAGTHAASSLKVAEAAKVIENTQLDLNIALVNELAMIFRRLGIDTLDVLEAAGSKWNFLPFRPGLVGGHCIGVDPYYLTAKAEQLGYHPEVILSGRRINDGMGSYIAQRAVKLLAVAGHPLKDVRVGILGLTFKENVPDIRNSRVPDIVSELRQFGIEPIIHDPLASPAETMHEYGLTVSRVGGAAEAVMEGETGFTVAKDSVDDLAARLRQLTHDPVLRQRLGQAARHRYEAEFTFERMYAATTAVYERVLFGRR